MFDWFGEKLTAFSDWLWSGIISLLTWLELLVDDVLTYLLLFPKYLFDIVSTSIVEFFEGIPVPDFMSSAGALFQGIPPDIVYYAGIFRVADGLAMVLSAYVLRFILRRIPFIG